MRGRARRAVAAGRASWLVDEWAVDVTAEPALSAALTAAEEAAAGVAYCSFADLFRESDYVSVHVPMEDATRGLVGAKQFALMKSGAAIVNTSRAEIIDRAALLDALQGGRLRGAALDVHYQEPMREDDPLLAMPNVILMPHTCGGSRLNGLADMVEMLQGIQADLRR